MRVAQPADGKGSLRWIQQLVARPALIDAELRRELGIAQDVEIDWRSPRADDDHAEYRDNAFLERVGLGEYCDRLSTFWPRNGPQWDALARTGDGKVILVEAKAHVNELASTCKASADSRATIERAMSEAKAGLGARSDADWLSGYYQYANRIAHLYFLRNRCGVDAHLIFLYLVNEKDMRGPKSRSEWETAIHNVHKALGLSSNRPLTAVHDVFVDVAKLERPGTGGSGERTSA